MSGEELNKFAAAFLFASLIALITGKVSDILYHKHNTTHTQGYVVEVTADASSQTGAQAEEIKFNVIALMASANAEKGKASANKCLMCHTFNKGEPNKVGPNLWNIVNDKIGQKDGFTFSDAMKAHGGTWGLEELFHFLHKPRDYIKGTKMTFVGVSKPQEIADIIAYLETLH